MKLSIGVDRVERTYDQAGNCFYALVLHPVILSVEEHLEFLTHEHDHVVLAELQPIKDGGVS
jgi:hypothetical protein